MGGRVSERAKERVMGAVKEKGRGSGERMGEWEGSETGALTDDLLVVAANWEVEVIESRHNL